MLQYKILTDNHNTVGKFCVFTFVPDGNKHKRQHKELYITFSIPFVYINLSGL